MVKEINNIKSRIEEIQIKDIEFCYDVKCLNLKTGNVKNSSFNNILEWLEFDNGNYFKSYSVYSNRILISHYLYTF